MTDESVASRSPAISPENLNGELDGPFVAASVARRSERCHRRSPSNLPSSWTRSSRLACVPCTAEGVVPVRSDGLSAHTDRRSVVCFPEGAAVGRPASPLRPL